ncbi:hypothetical protein Ptr902_03653 [Pyrenophora tritici-repentis]|nr:hypothetical protein Ptr902_03653 [Pyrenophora tritici-repentis]
MAPKMPAPPSVKNKSRPAGGLYERAIAMQQEQLDKYQMQNSNNLQTELQTIIDRVVRELNVTKKDLAMTNRDELEEIKKTLESSDENLAAMERELEAAKQELENTKHVLSQWQDAYATASNNNDSLRTQRKADAPTITNLKSTLKKEKARA